jgi:NAD(P)-dependent dehydrogenase (short-subunit alcohol dehydrogenase family)
MRSVLVTGSSTGIGRATALRLDAYGWRVYAGIRSQEDARSLGRDGSRHLRPIVVDVTSDESIRCAVETIGEPLHGLVNNAGVTVQAPLEYLPPDEMRRQLEVNVVGHLACTQAFLPALRAGKGRVVFVSSVQGKLRSLPLLGPYCASKWAIEAIAETFRIELGDSGVDVSIVEPGTIDTPIWEKANEAFGRVRDGLPPEGRERYAQLLKRGETLTKIAATTGVVPDRVARAIQRALESKSPRIRYRVGDASWRVLAEAAVPSRTRDWFISNVLVGGRSG